MYTRLKTGKNKPISLFSYLYMDKEHDNQKPKCKNSDTMKVRITKSSIDQHVDMVKTQLMRVTDFSYGISIFNGSV